MIARQDRLPRWLLAGGVLAVVGYFATELWLLLKPDERPHEAVAQRIIGLALREAFLRFALYFASGAAAMLVTLLLITFFGRPRV